jgi:hypothetical protein
MSKASLVNHAVNRLVSPADAVGRLAQGGGGFAAVIAAFESRDPAAFRRALERLEMFTVRKILLDEAIGLVPTHLLQVQPVKT